MIIATLLVRNEEDIVAECIEHHLNNGVDKIIATDNGSDDKTRDILSSYKEVIEIIDEYDLTYEQGKWVTRMARKATEYDPDWIVHIDADEFWYGLKSLYEIKEDIVFLPPYFYEHLPIPNLKDGKFDKKNFPCFYKCGSMGRLAHRPNKNIVISQGNHKVENFDDGKVLKLTNDLICMHHYPIRAYERYERKIINGGQAYEKYPGSKNDGSHWRILYEKYKQGILPQEYEKIIDIKNYVGLVPL